MAEKQKDELEGYAKSLVPGSSVLSYFLDLFRKKKKKDEKDKKGIKWAKGGRPGDKPDTVLTEK